MIQEIKITDYPCVIFSDSHCNISNIKELQRLYPKSLLLSLGDETFLFSKPGEKFNSHIINFFIKHKIPNLLGNHSQHILNCSIGNSLTNARLIRFDESSSFVDADIYDLTQQQIDYLRKLPIGFKIILPDGSNYLAFHSRPNDLWSFTEEAFTKDSFLKTYPIDNNTRAVLIGHNHRNFIVDYPGISAKLIGIGHLCGSDHHSKKNNGGNYALLTENGIEFKKL